METQREVRPNKKVKGYEGDRKIWKDFKLKHDTVKFLPFRDYSD